MPATPPPLPTSGNQLVELLREAMQPALDAAFADVVDGLRQPMLDRLERMELDRGPYLDGLLALKDRRELILRGFREDMAAAWQAAAEGEAPTARFGQEQPGSDLGLVEEDELDVRLATDQLADLISREWQSELLRLNGYLTWLDMGVRLAPDSAPYSPARIAMAVYRGFARASLPGNVRALAVQCCGREFVELLGPIYESLHARLVRRLGAQDSTTSRVRRAQAIPSSGDEASSEPDWMTRFFVSWDQEEGSANAASPDAASLPPALHHLLEASRQQRAREGDAARPPSSRTSLSQRELVVALTLVQIASPEVHAEVLADPRKLQAAFKQQIFLHAAQLGVAPEAVAISEADENVVDLVGMLFEVIFRESHLGDEQVHVLGRLMAPMTKVALQDRKLFLQATHSARRLLNLLVEACDGNPGENEAQRLLLEKVRDTVQRLVADFDESQSVFRTARTDFNDFYARYRTEAEKAEEALAAEQRAKDAEAAILAGFAATLEAKLQGREVPAAMRHILREGWPAYAARMQSLNKPQAAPMMLDGLLQAIDDAHVRDDVRAWHTAMDWLQPMWMASGNSRAAIAALRETLFAALVTPQAAAPEPRAATSEPAPALPQPVLPGLLETHEWVEGLEHLDPVMTDYFQQLREGSWLDFVDKDNRVQAGRLSWISPVSRRLMFVNRAGARICVASVQELVVMAQLGRVRMHRDEDAFYSAMQGVVDRLVTPAPP
ncbi:DUF1631 family protein [Pseudoxanthomonas sp. PXM02]|uniref:DUF1631 family protein n=1 Tax=Pseudoxanthomonas sp. PXM02 TaxID=2769294 RepID=UPI00177E0C45|nr:DUF1631 family protein [Pseudoxanthomonas sp. PXM02]MBD9478412.1 DUF1631 family protein [Pseudoxanthomonas sp. PXM02]